MSEVLIKNWQKKTYKKGIFEGFTVMGFQYESATGEIGWHITAWLMRDPIHDYWVAGRRFYSMSIHFACLGTNRTVIQIFDEINGLDSKEKQAVLKAITTWESSTGAET